MDDTQTLSIAAPDGTKLRATPFTDDQMIAFSLVRGADGPLTIEIISSLFKSAFGAETYRIFAVRMASGDATASLKTMVELLAEAVKATQEAKTTAATDGS